MSEYHLYCLKDNFVCYCQVLKEHHPIIKQGHPLLFSLPVLFLIILRKVLQFFAVPENHIYEYQKGVRRMVLFTFNKKYEDFAIRRLESQNIKYVIQPVGNERLNLYFGREECLNAIRMIVTRPLNQLTPEEDFMLGAMLGYDICAQCERYCERKDKCNCSCNCN